jgi:hypothetical protein
MARALAAVSTRRLRKDAMVGGELTDTARERGEAAVRERLAELGVIAVGRRT